MRFVNTFVILFLVLAGCGQTAVRDYPGIVAGIEKKRSEFKASYDLAQAVDKSTIIARAREYITTVLAEDVFPCWYGTQWDFNGTTRTPGKGKIACGYFVTNVLTDAGFDIPRIKWAQSASEVMIKSLCAGNDIRRFSGASIEEVAEHLQKSGDGLYLAGLDIHVGFILVKGKKMSFIHSNYYHPEKGVMSEDIDTKNPLKDSKYRVIGKLFSDTMIINWISGHAYK